MKEILNISAQIDSLSKNKNINFKSEKEKEEMRIFLQRNNYLNVISLKYLFASGQKRDSVRSGVIQNYEVCYESAWKAIKRWIEENIEEIDGITRRTLFIKAFENKLIFDVEKWMLFHKARNSTSHIYEEETAEEVYKIAFDFIIDVKKLYKKLEVR